MPIEPATATRVADSLRATLDAEMPPDGWERVSELVQQIDQAVAAGQANRVAELAAELEAIRSRGDAQGDSGGDAGSPALVRAGLQRGEGRRLNHPVVITVLLLVSAVLVLLAVAALQDSEGGGGSPSGGYDDYTTTTVARGVRDQSPFSDEVDLPVRETGGLTIELTWSTVANLDLLVTDPDGTAITPSNPGPTRTGGMYTGIGNSGCVHEGKESVSWGKAQPGHYVIEIVSAENEGCGADGYAVTLRSGADEIRRIRDPINTIHLRVRPVSSITSTRFSRARARWLCPFPVVEKLRAAEKILAASSWGLLLAPRQPLPLSL